MLLRGLRKFRSENKLIKLKMSDMDPHLFPKGTPIPKTTTIGTDELWVMHEKMYTIRRFEIASDTLYKQKKIRGFCHLYDGEEGLGVGLEHALDFNDAIITGYRQHGTAILRGIPIYNMFCETTQKKDGCSKGKGGSMHCYKMKNHYFGGNGIVGAQVPVGVGAALAMKYMGNKKNVSLSLYGDGASNQGQISEVANMAALWKLPAIFVCENNGIALGTTIERGTAGGGDFHKKLHDVPGLKVNGFHCPEVKEAMAFAKAYAVEHGPVVLNIITYRYHGHGMSDPGLSYRTRDEISDMRKKHDCIHYVEQLLIDNKAATEEEIAEQKEKISNFVDAEAERAINSEPIPASELTTDVFSPDFKRFVRGRNYEESIFIKEKLVE